MGSRQYLSVDCVLQILHEANIIKSPKLEDHEKRPDNTYWLKHFQGTRNIIFEVLEGKYVSSFSAERCCRDSLKASEKVTEKILTDCQAA